ncbi:MAG: glycoside hydrolase family 2 protein [Bacteroidota bacterium]|nr:glycoside hydrolase family 2 protein [Bacteroidota bacterium]
MKRVELNDSWSVKANDAYTLLLTDHQRVLDWFPAHVPGTIHTDLLEQKIIPDPFYRMNENDVQWVENLQWNYRKEFSVDAALLKEQHITLVAEGLDTYAEILINGKSIAVTENMFVEHRIDVKKYLRAGNNTIEIHFDSPVVRSKQLENKYGKLRVALEPHRVYVRKAQYSYSWDWGPKLTTSGIWRPIYLEVSSGPVLRNPFVKTLNLTKKSATIEVSVDIEHLKSPVKVMVRIEGNKYSNEIVKQATSSTLKFKMKIDAPSIWWPNGYGEQPLYDVTFSLQNNNGTTSEAATTFGIRTINLLQEKDKEGKSFIIVVNGEKIFCKGADWIPSDNFIPRISDSKYERLLTLARDANMNMMRVWGGGIYEQDAFYTLCDKLGLLVWQDFMFACGEYPQTPWFLKLVKDEATKAVTRLRNHPSLAVWCGNNECEWLFCTENPEKTADDMTGSVIFRELLPTIVKKLDNSRPYWRSSPFGAGFPNDETNGTHHQWTVWSFWKDYKEYEKTNARFVSEFGFQAPANIRTWEEATLPEDRTPQHPVIEHHNKQVEGQERLFRFQAGHYTVGKNFNDFVYRGQLVQANALKTAVEHWRRRKFNTSGALYWQLNDCWPVSSWAVIDSGLRPKAAYFYTKRFFAKVLVSIKRNENNIEVWGTNDSLDRFKGMLQVQRLTFTGDKKFSNEIEIVIKQNSSSKIFAMPIDPNNSADQFGSYIAAQLLSDGYVISENRFFFAEPKHLHLPRPKITNKILEKKENSYQISIQTDLFAKDIRIEIEGCDAEFNDNYFDMDAGALKIIQCKVPESEKRIEGKIVITSLRNE